jgi:VWFA-related protein
MVLLAQEQSPVPPTPVIRTTAHIVLVDVIATDKNGTPVTGLTKDDFRVEENGKSEKVSMFSLEAPAAEGTRPQAPPGVYTNRPAYHMPDTTATILLLDGLNSPFRNQSFARFKLMEYAASQIGPNHPIAVYSLGNHLYELQDFTTDPSLIRAALSAFHPQAQTGTTLAPLHGSSAVATGLDGTVNANSTPLLLASARSFVEETSVTDLQFRIDRTLDAMNDLARMVAGHPGRKNLVWVTAGLPFSLIPSDNAVEYANVGRQDPTEALGGQAPLPVNPNGVDAEAFARQDIRSQAQDRVKKAAALLASEQVSIYPVDVRGVVVSGATDAAGTGIDGAGFLITDKAFGSSVSAGNAALEASQSNMEDLAKQTGGRMYKNRNDIENAVAEASNDGGTYYEIAYSPEKAKFDGSFHKIKISVDKPGVQLRYRPGYFAVDQAKGSENDRKNDLVLALNSPSDSSMVIFDAHVGQQPGAKELPIEVLVRPDSISAEQNKDKRQIDVDYFAVVVNNQGKQVSMQGKTAKAALSDDQYQAMMKQGLLLSLNVPTPAPGHYDFRLAVRDNKTGYIGTVHAPVDIAK